MSDPARHAATPWARILALGIGLVAAAASGADGTPDWLRLGLNARVTVVGPHAQGPGIVVGGFGQVLTCTDFVALDRASVRTARGVQTARVTLANAHLGIALLQADPRALPPPVAARTDAHPPKATYALLPAQPPLRVFLQPSAHPARDPLLVMDPPAPAGTAVIDEKGRLVGLVVQGRGARRRVAPLWLLRLELEGARR